MLVVTFRPFTVSRRIDEEGADHGHDGADQWAASEAGRITPIFPNDALTMMLPGVDIGTPVHGNDGISGSEG